LESHEARQLLEDVAPKSSLNEIDVDAIVQRCGGTPLFVEEIARFRLDDVPFTLPERRAMFGTMTREQQLRRRVEDLLAGLGFAEIYTPSLRLDDETTWKLPEPIAVELTALRTSLLPSLVEAARRNVDAGAERIALFELARVYLSNGDLPNERLHVAGIAEGGFARVKGVVFGAWDDKAGMAGSVEDLLRHPVLNHRPQVHGGVCAAACGAMLREMFAARRATSVDSPLVDQ